MGILVKRFFIGVVLVAALFSIGCTHIYNIPDVSLKNQGIVDLVDDEQIDITINLCLTEELKATKWEKHMNGDTFIIPIGNQLAKNASELSEMIFKEVVVTSIPTPGGAKHCNAVLTPKVIVIERTIGATAFGESIFTIILEWKLEDTQYNAIWTDSIKGEGRANIGNTFTHKSNAEKQMEMLLKDLFGKSFEAIRTSPEIIRFAKNRN